MITFEIPQNAWNIASDNRRSFPHAVLENRRHAASRRTGAKSAQSTMVPVARG